jgi:hypothetical protein
MMNGMFRDEEYCEQVISDLSSPKRLFVAVTNAFGPSTGLSLSKCTRHGLQNIASENFHVYVDLHISM